MYTNILSVMRCPHCGGEFELTAAGKEGEEILEGKIACGNGHVFVSGREFLIFSPRNRKTLIPGASILVKRAMMISGRRLRPGKRRSRRKLTETFWTQLWGRPQN